MKNGKSRTKALGITYIQIRLVTSWSIESRSKGPKTRLQVYPRPNMGPLCHALFCPSDIKITSVILILCSLHKVYSACYEAVAWFLLFRCENAVIV